MNLAFRVRRNIRYFLEAQGKTYGDLGWPRNYVSDVVNNLTGLSEKRTQEFADRLHVDVSELTVLRPEFKETRKP